MILSCNSACFQIPPQCEAIQCGVSELSPHLQLYNEKTFSAGELAKFRCGPGYMISGSPVSVCGGDGKWSPPWSKISCLPACIYPGAIIHGNMSPVLFYYRLGGSVEYSCLPGFRLEGKPVLTCGKRGRWDAPIPRCVNIRKD